MSELCPLCGKYKSEKAVFCDDCKSKVETEYEVDVPETESDIHVLEGNQSPAAVVESDELPEKHPVIDTSENETVIISSESHLNRKKKKRGIIFMAILILAVLLVVGFFYYGQVVKKGNLDRSKWETATRENTIGAYLSYMEEFPQGKYYNDAEKKVMNLKTDEVSAWHQLQRSENTAELRDFMNKNADSPYIPLIKKRLDSLTWVATLNDNTAEGYSKYMVLSQSGEFDGDYFAEAKDRYDMLFQSYPVTKTHLDSIKMVVDGFFTALSSVNANRISSYLAPTVYRFFDVKGGTREEIVGNLIISGSRSQAPTIKFAPTIDATAYERTLIEHYDVNVPVQKSFLDENGQNKIVSGYIVHMELDRDFKIITINETKPFQGAP